MVGVVIRGWMMRRREFIAVLGGAAAWPELVRAQQVVKTIGFMSGGSSSAFGPLVAVLVGRLRELGWVEGANLVIEYRWADGLFARLRDYATEFVHNKVDVIIAEGTVSAIAAKQSTRTISIVVPVASDPIGNKLIDSLAHPGGNVTGLSIQATDLAPKRLELLREIVPGLTRLGIMGNFESPNAVVELKEAEGTARALGIEAKHIGIRYAEDIASVFGGLKGRVDSLYIAPDPLVFSNREKISMMALELKLPTIYAYRDYVESGGLVSYGPNIRSMFRRAAELVDKVLRGTKAGDIPVEQPTNFELVINLKTAKALGLEIPPQLLARADEVIE
jgi:putative ABC transport system substrate-binding protein